MYKESAWRWQFDLGVDHVADVSGNEAAAGRLRHAQIAEEHPHAPLLRPRLPHGGIACLSICKHDHYTPAREIRRAGRALTGHRKRVSKRASVSRTVLLFNIYNTNHGGAANEWTRRSQKNTPAHPPSGPG